MGVETLDAGAGSGVSLGAAEACVVGLVDGARAPGAACGVAHADASTTIATAAAGHRRRSGSMRQRFRPTDFSPCQGLRQKATRSPDSSGAATEYLVISAWWRSTLPGTGKGTAVANDEKTDDERIDEASQESFPASDPPGYYSFSLGGNSAEGLSPKVKTRRRPGSQPRSQRQPPR